AMATLRRLSIALARRRLDTRTSRRRSCTLRMKQLAKTTLKRCEVAAAILLTVVLLVCHAIFFLHAGPLWRDEISSLALATKPTLSEFWKSLPLDPFPASYFLLLRLWHAVGLGGSEIALRGLGLLIGLSLIGSLWRACYLID